MPFEEEEEATENDTGIDLILSKFIDYADKRLCDKLGDVASVDTLIDWREDFEKRIRSYFKETVVESNSQVSSNYCLNLLQTLAIAKPITSKLKINDV